jgi:hypothetical protein
LRKYEIEIFLQTGLDRQISKLPVRQIVDGRYRKPQRPGDFQYFPGAKCWSRASPLFFQHGVTLLDQPVELLLLPSNPFGCSFFILCAGGSSSLFNQLSHIVLQYRDAIVEFR